jgi:hypothetical protein
MLLKAPAFLEEMPRLHYRANQYNQLHQPLAFSLQPQELEPELPE